jgi:hypothetical protein
MKRFSDWPVLKWDGERWDMMVEVWYQGSWDRFLRTLPPELGPLYLLPSRP